jgi:hypothetical protein
LSGTADRRGEQRQPDRRQGIGIDQCRKIGFPALAQRFDEHRKQRHQQEEREETPAASPGWSI